MCLKFQTNAAKHSAIITWWVNCARKGSTKSRKCKRNKHHQRIVEVSWLFRRIRTTRVGSRGDTSWDERNSERWYSTDRFYKSKTAKFTIIIYPRVYVFGKGHCRINYSEPHRNKVNKKTEQHKEATNERFLYINKTKTKKPTSVILSEKREKKVPKMKINL